MFSDMQAIEDEMKEQAEKLRLRHFTLGVEAALNLIAENWGYDNWRHFQVCLDDARQGLMVVRPCKKFQREMRHHAAAT